MLSYDIEQLEVGMKRIVETTLIVFCLSVPYVSAADTDVDKALDKTKEGAIELFEIAKEKSAQIGENILDKSAELGDEANKKAEKTGEAFWNKMKEIGSASKKLAEDGSEKLKDFACDLSDKACLDAAKQESPQNLDNSI